MGRKWKGFGQEVGWVLGARDMDSLDLPGLDELANEVVANIDMFDTRMMLVVGGQGDSTEIIAFDQTGARLWVSHLCEC